MGGKLRFDAGYLAGAVSEKDLEIMALEAAKANRLLMDGTGPGGESLGWVNLPAEWTEEGLREIEEAAAELKSISDSVVVVGIGGSYLGARAGIEFLTPGAVGSDIFFAGQNMSGDYLADLLDCLIDREVSVVVISKSGTTTEPAIAFRLLEDLLKKKYGQGKIKKRIVCITDREKGALKSLARMEEYRTFSIPDNIGGRFSVLTPVGLFPMACAGIAVGEIVSGARDQMAHSAGCNIESNASCYYAAIRNILYGKGKKIEMLSNFDPELHYISEWWKQLFGESEGKKGRGIFPASCDLSTDLHSMGQLMQEGERNIFETFLIVDSGTKRCVIPKSREDIDGLNYLAGFDVDHVNNKAYIATAEAHFEGGVPNMTVGIPDKSAFSLGQLFYFFERTVAISGYIAGVNPFDQPGVESYKKKMFNLLGKPGA